MLLIDLFFPSDFVFAKVTPLLSPSGNDTDERNVTSTLDLDSGEDAADAGPGKKNTIVLFLPALNLRLFRF